MDKNKQTIETEKIAKKFEKGSSQPRANMSRTTSEDIFDRLLKERAVHREKMLGYVTNLTFFSFYLLVGIVIVQAVVRIVTLYTKGTSDFTVLDNYQLNIFAVSVFGQAIGVIVIIVKSLWDDESYLKKI
ncbi:hypothetical protein A3A93_04140 [Candidatus Roizmanbacteria bacterium RIFCSPLOWO2_01_FULL_38_12]|uniref:Uncharacterized protein n=1 Tax=Candidatus Roizmanbacteria bacterium RIFCSPLOWO2_01_FULL_38_12 TaxID=1802061 RepID=A0A1F7IV28_9BACT|nr:MAG: hypothetical protein A3A93_04140 [Candidatus Roizmanbacteria bacterium RIFCSPLOWO2_01_FULL_38_12]